MGGRGSFERPMSRIRTCHRTGRQRRAGSSRLCAYLSPRIEGPSLFRSWSKLTKPNLSESEFPGNAKLTLRQAGNSRFSKNRSLPVATEVCSLAEIRNGIYEEIELQRRCVRRSALARYCHYRSCHLNAEMQQCHGEDHDDFRRA
jgi:hypothetical protein